MSIALILAGATFISSGVKIGDQVLITDAPSNMFTGGTVDPNNFPGQFLVTGITGQTGLTYDGFLNGTALGLTLNSSATGTVEYSVVHNLSKDEQVASIIAVANGLASKRVTLVWPPVAQVKNSDGTFTQVDGTFLAACLASAKSANPAQQGFTNFPIPGPYSLEYSNGYFSKSQLKTLADNGVLVFCQDAPGANIYALRQVTTDTSSFINMELSCVTAEDKVSTDLVALFKPFIGPYDITQDFLSFLNQKGDNYMFQAMNTKAPKCGALVLDGKINSILANIGNSNPTIPDGTVQVTASIELGKPNNWTDITLLVS
jgi:hypothetical protein